MRSPEAEILCFSGCSNILLTRCYDFCTVILLIKWQMVNFFTGCLIDVAFDNGKLLIQNLALHHFDMQVFSCNSCNGAEIGRGYKQSRNL